MIREQWRWFDKLCMKESLSTFLTCLLDRVHFLKENLLCAFSFGVLDFSNQNSSMVNMFILNLLFFCFLYLHPLTFINCRRKLQTKRIICCTRIAHTDITSTMHKRSNSKLCCWLFKFKNVKTP